MKLINSVRLIGMSVGLGLCLVPSARAQFLVGAGFYSSTTNGTSNPSYLYSTDLSQSGVVLPLLLSPNGGNSSGKNIAIPLATGANNFAFTNNNSQNPGNFGGLELFFDTTATPYNPASSLARTPDLAVFAPTDSSGTFATPGAGTLIESYDFSGSIAANGLQSYSSGGITYSVSAFSTSTSPAGSFTINVSGVASTPEPGVAALLAGMGLAGSTLSARLRKRRRPARA